MGRGPFRPPMPAATGKSRLKINRFTVMAMLQAARARSLGLSEGSAYSWGLNRAIFFAAAKRGFRGKADSLRRPDGTPDTSSPEMYSLGDDGAYVDPDRPGPYFRIGGETQTEQDFERQIASRFGDRAHFEKAWAEAMEIVRSHDPTTLRSRKGFYGEVYKPRRDRLVDEWTQRYGARPS